MQHVNSTPEAQALATAVAANDRRRAAAWQLRFRIVSATILALIGLFIAVYLNVDGSFVTRAAPFIFQGVFLTIAVSLLSIALATVLATFGAQIGRAHV